LRFARQALQIDSLLPHAYSALGAATAFYEWSSKEGLGLARRAIELEPSYSFGHQIYGCCLLQSEETDQACAHLERAVALNPLSVREHRMLGWSLYLLRNSSEARKLLEAVLVMHPEPAETHYLLARLYLSEGRFETALEHARQAQALPPDPLSLGILGACLARLKRRDEALEILARLSRLSETRYIDPSAMAHVQIALGDTGSAIASVGKMLDERIPFAAIELRLDPEFDSLRSEPKFRALLSRLERK